MYIRFAHIFYSNCYTIDVQCLVCCLCSYSTNICCDDDDDDDVTNVLSLSSCCNASSNTGTWSKCDYLREDLLKMIAAACRSV